MNPDHDNGDGISSHFILYDWLIGLVVCCWSTTYVCLLLVTTPRQQDPPLQLPWTGLAWSSCHALWLLTCFRTEECQQVLLFNNSSMLGFFCKYMDLARRQERWFIYDCMFCSKRIIEQLKCLVEILYTHFILTVWGQFRYLMSQTDANERHPRHHLDDWLLSVWLVMRTERKPPQQFQRLNAVALLVAILVLLGGCNILRRVQRLVLVGFVSLERIGCSLRGVMQYDVREL